MSQTNRQSEQPVESESSLETTLGRYKSMLENIKNQLLYDADLRTITKGAIDKFEEDLRSIVEGVEKLRANPRSLEFISSIDAIQINVRNVIKNLYVASSALEVFDTLGKIEQITTKRDIFFPSLESCVEPLRKAIEQFKT